MRLNLEMFTNTDGKNVEEQQECRKNLNFLLTSFYLNEFIFKIFLFRDSVIGSVLFPKSLAHALFQKCLNNFKINPVSILKH